MLNASQDTQSPLTPEQLDVLLQTPVSLRCSMLFVKAQLEDWK